MCKIHGRFEQTPSQHLTGRGCKDCGITNSALKQTFTRAEFIERAIQEHGDNYDYTEVKYVNSQTKIIIKCKMCKFVFEQQPNSHLQGSGCDKCAHAINHENQKLSTEERIKRATEVHGDKFDYSNMNYTNYNSLINIKCNKCNENFQQLYSNHIKQNKGCPNCDSNITEKKLYEFLSVQYPNLIKQYKKEWCKNKRYLPFDCCIPDIKIIIELDGAQHFKQVMTWPPPEKTQEIDKYKMKCANENGFSVIRIIQTDVLYDKYDWKEALNKNIEKIIIEQKIQNIYICKNNEYKIYN
jgi:very-short-patch-repair endonuclease